MPLPLLAGIVVLASYAMNAWRAATFIRAIWHAMTVMRATGSAFTGLRVVGTLTESRIIQLTYRGADYTIKALKSGKVTVRAIKEGAEVPAGLVKELGTVLSRAEGFQGIYSGARATAKSKPALEMLFKMGL